MNELLRSQAPSEMLPPPITMEELETLRARYLRAQIEENAAVRSLSELMSRADAAKAHFKQVFAEVMATRARADAAYETWKKAMQQFNETANDRTKARPTPGRAASGF
jgi:hypothetical protein